MQISSQQMCKEHTIPLMSPIFLIVTHNLTEIYTIREGNVKHKKCNLTKVAKKHFDFVLSF